MTIISTWKRKDRSAVHIGELSEPQAEKLAEKIYQLVGQEFPDAPKEQYAFQETLE